MRLGFNIAIVCIVTLICVTSVLIVAVASGFDGALISGGCATLVGIPTFLLTKFAYTRKTNNK